jgi:hypothetical protein
VEGSGESFELTVRYTIEVSDCGYELDVGECKLVEASFLSVIHGVEVCRIVLLEVSFEDEVSS